MSSPSSRILNLNRVVRAGAGAGKTTALVDQVLQFAKDFSENSKTLPKVAVTTFTRKATQELRERLTQKALQTADPNLISFVQKPSQLHISTIHGVLTLFLRKYGSLIDLTPRFKIVDRTLETKIYRRVLKNTLNPERAAILDELSLAQVQEAMIQYFCLRFQDEAPPLLWSKVEIQRIIDSQLKVWTSKAYHLVETLRSSETTPNWSDYIQLLSECLKHVEEHPEMAHEAFLKWKKERPAARFKKGTLEDLRELRSEVQSLAEDWSEDYFVTREGLETSMEINQRFASWAEEVAQRVYQSKLELGLLSMSDLEIFAWQLLQKSEDARKAFSQEWDYWLIDEYQDTSPLQVKILRSMIDAKPFYVVGDPQQSIYLFRGARAEVFTQKESENAQNGGQNLQKRVNYRSCSEVVHFLNHFFKHLSPDFAPMEVGKINTTTLIKNPLPAATFIDCTSEEHENLQTQAVVQRCWEKIKSGISPEKICILARTNSELQKISNWAAVQGLEVQVHASADFYSRSEIKDALAILRFLVNPHDNLNFLSLLRSPWYKVSDNFIAENALEAPASFWLNFEALLETANESSMDLKSIENLRSLQVLVRATSHQGLGAIWRQALWDCGLMLSARQIDSSGRREANLWKIISQVQTLERRPGFSYSEFCQNFKSELDTDSADGDSDATPVIVPQRVNLMTVHASKGLQFEHVILVSVGRFRHSPFRGCFVFDETRNRFWLSMRNPQTGALQIPPWSRPWLEEMKSRLRQEYDRILYVALTRAQNSMDLFWEKNEKDSWLSRMWVPSTVEHGSFQTATKKGEELLAEKELRITKENKSTQVRRNPLQFSENRMQIISVSKIIEDFDQKIYDEGPAVESKTILKTSKSIPESLEKALEGVAVHRLFESLRYKSSPAIAQKDSEKKALQFIHSWNQGEMLHWIEDGFVEWGFTIPFQNSLIQGQIDLWTLSDNHLHVIDYKTGSERGLEKAMNQLQIYAWALRKANKFTSQEDSKIRLWAVYPLSGKTYERSAMPMKEVESKWLRPL